MSSLSVPIAPVPDHFIFDIFLPHQAMVDTTPDITELRKLLLQQLTYSTLERYDGDLQCRVDKLLGPSDVQRFLEFLGFVMLALSNSHELRRRDDIIIWIASQSWKVLDAIFALRLETFVAFVDFLIQSEIKYAEWLFTKSE
jgi:hypothetical protein